MLFVKPRYWVVVDDLAGSAEHLIEHRFQFADLPSERGRATGLARRRPGGRGLLVRAFARVPLERELRSGELSPDYGWVPPATARCRSAPVLV